MSAGGGHPDGRNGADSAASVRGAVPVVLVRYRPGVAGESARTVHLVPLPDGGRLGTVSALCGRLLRPEEVEQVTPGEGMPCSVCAVSHVAGAPAQDAEPATPAQDTEPATPASPGSADEFSPDAGLRTAELCYRAWGWAVALRRDQIWLRLDAEAVALTLPIPLAVRVTALLIQRRCPPAVLVHPDAPDHNVLLAGERYPVALPLPAGVHRATGTLLLPPTTTPRGPLTWIHPPGPYSLRLCREVDVITALRALDDLPPTTPTAF